MLAARLTLSPDRKSFSGELLHDLERSWPIIIVKNPAGEYELRAIDTREPKITSQTVLSFWTDDTASEIAARDTKS